MEWSRSGVDFFTWLGVTASLEDVSSGIGDCVCERGVVIC